MTHRWQNAVSVLAVTCGLGLAPLSWADPPLDRGSGIESAAIGEPAVLAPRRAAKKEASPALPADTPLARIVVKFQEGTRVRLRGGALTTLARDERDRRDLAARGLTEAGVADDVREAQRLIAQAPRVLGISRLFQQSEDLLSTRRRQGEEQSGRELADLDLYYQLRLPPGTTDIQVEELLNVLNQLESVEIAYAEPVSTPAATEPIRGIGAPIQFCQSPDFQSLQGYLNPAPQGVDALYAWSQPVGAGQGVKIVDVEEAWRLTHEDLPPVFYAGGTQNPSLSWRNHGTAVLGEIVGTGNGCGVTGIANQAQVGVQSDFGISTASAISTAATQAGPTGVVLIELHRQGPPNSSDCTCNTLQCDFVAMENWQAEFDAIATATANGTIVVEAAGNGSSNLDDPAYENRFNRSFRDSGAILVAASLSTSRTPTCWTNWGSRIDVHAWGENVVTAGYGDLQFAGGNEDLWYTSVFGGTSSASPIVTGSVASVRAAASARGHGTLSPSILRQFLKNTGTPQVTDPKNIGPMPNLRAAYEQLTNDQPPVANFTVSCSDFSCSFNGSSSTDNVGIVSYTWSFGDTASGSGVTTSHTYAGRGSYTVTLTVTDTHGLTHAKSTIVTVALPRDAQVVSQSVPATMIAGRTYAISITLKNVGSLSWSPIGPQCNAFRLGSANPYNNGTWVPATRVDLSAPVAPGGQVTLNFTVTPPSTPGTYNFQWQMLQECVTWFGDFTPNVAVTVQSALPRDAQFVSQSVPATMSAGRVYPVSVTLKNVGTLAWNPIGSQCNAYRLGSANPYNNGTWVPVTRVELPAPVAPGGQVTLSFNVTAPSTPGTYNFQWQMVQECVTWFGDFTPNVAVTVQAAPQRDAQVFSQSVPATMVAGETYPVSVTLKNVGTLSWNPIGPQCNSYRLGSANPYNNGTWVPVARVDLPATVAPGGQVTLSFNVTAPSTPGTYNFQWQMVQECVTWFGDFTPNVAVTVQAAVRNAQILSQSVPSNMTAGGTYPVSVTVKNTGNQTWSPIGPGCGSYHLGSANFYNNTTWGPTRIDLPAPMGPGGQVTLSFNVTAPSTPGTYNFQWQMLQECVTWFGDFTPNVAVTVSP